GLCAKGPNVMIYPQQSGFAAVTEEDTDDIIARLESMLD
ncbi:MAG: (2Fe-2S) ferredoxin domain-containing protein, partial [Deltaproteobacteria bacterium]|nr:(2Fe-2S) ferredoxin domain-containing protein [Deltaproteobacteria bacterium]